jgi:microtubule-associated protein-like 6
LPEKPPKGDNDLYSCEDLDYGDEFGACKPWMGAIKEPTGYKPDKGLDNVPKVTPKREYVWGLRAKDTRSNVRFTAQGKVVYHTAALGIVLDAAKNT